MKGHLDRNIKPLSNESVKANLCTDHYDYYHKICVYLIRVILNCSYVCGMVAVIPGIFAVLKKKYEKISTLVW